MVTTAVINKRALASDEENTSEYSHPPSSQSSTLESNPDVQRAFRRVGSLESTPKRYGSVRKRTLSACNIRNSKGTDDSSDGSSSASQSETDEVSNITVATSRMTIYENESRL